VPTDISVFLYLRAVSYRMCETATFKIRGKAMGNLGASLVGIHRTVIYHRLFQDYGSGLFSDFPKACLHRILSRIHGSR
jgi:hypothetical protein